MTVPRCLQVDAAQSDYTYTTSQLTFENDATEIFLKIQVQGGVVVQECENCSHTRSVEMGKCK